MTDKLSSSMKNATTSKDKKVDDENENSNKKSFKLGKSIDPSDFGNMPSILKSRYSFYAEPSTKVNEAQISSKKRLKQLRKSQVIEREKKLQEIIDTNSMYSTSMISLNKNKKMTLNETEKMVEFERERHERLIGQLKAAEARNRVRILKTRYNNCKQDEIDTLIGSQQTALKAVRLEVFLSSCDGKQPGLKGRDLETLNPIERRRLDALIDDTNNSLINRKLN